MEKNIAKSIINDNIKTYKLLRNNEIYNNMRLNSVAEAFRVNSLNIATLPDTAISIGYAVSLLIGTIYLEQLLVHPITKVIDRLRKLEDSVSTTSLVKNMTEEEFEGNKKEM